MDRQCLIGGSVHSDTFEPGDWRIGDRRLGEELTPILAEMLSDVPDGEEIKLTVDVNAEVDGAKFQPTYVGSVPGWVEGDDDVEVSTRKGVVTVFRGGVEYSELDSLFTVGHEEVVRRVAQVVGDLVGELDEQAATVNLEVNFNLIRLIDQLGNDADMVAVEGDTLVAEDPRNDIGVGTESVSIVRIPAGEEVPA